MLNKPIEEIVYENGVVVGVKSEGEVNYYLKIFINILRLLNVNLLLEIHLIFLIKLKKLVKLLAVFVSYLILSQIPMMLNLVRLLFHKKK